MKRLLTNSLAPVAIGRLRAAGRLLLMTMLLFTFLGGAGAQETLTVYDGQTQAIMFHSMAYMPTTAHAASLSFPQPTLVPWLGEPSQTSPSIALMLRRATMKE